MSEQDVERMATFGYYADEQCRVMAPDGRIVSMAYSQASAQRFADELNKLSRRAQSPASGEREATIEECAKVCERSAEAHDRAARQLTGMEMHAANFEAQGARQCAFQLRALAPRPAQPVECDSSAAESGSIACGDVESDAARQAAMIQPLAPLEPGKPWTLEEALRQLEHYRGVADSTGVTEHLEAFARVAFDWVPELIAAVRASPAPRPAQTGDGPLVKECLVEHRVDFLSTYVPPQTIAEFKRAATTQFDVALADARFNARKLSAGPAPVAGKAEEFALLRDAVRCGLRLRNVFYDVHSPHMPDAWVSSGNGFLRARCIDFEKAAERAIGPEFASFAASKPLEASPLAGKAGETWPRDGEVVEVSIENVARLCRIIDELRAAPVRAEETSEEFIAAADALRRTIGKPWEFDHGHSNLPPSECPVCQCFREFDRTRACMAVKT